MLCILGMPLIHLADWDFDFPTRSGRHPTHLRTTAAHAAFRRIGGAHPAELDWDRCSLDVRRSRVRLPWGISAHLAMPPMDYRLHLQRSLAH